jgi:hypothetical protein
MFADVRGEHRLGGRVEGTLRIIRVAGLALGWADLVIGEHVAAHQRGKAGQDDGGEAGGVIKLGEIPGEPYRLPKSLQRNVHGRALPGPPRLYALVRIDALMVRRY